MMKIAIIGAGAMGSIYGSILSRHHDVSLIDVNTDLVDKINNDGIVLQSNEDSTVYYPKAYTSSLAVGVVDLVIVFVKSLFTEAALAANHSLISSNTYVLTLQNGFGQEEVLGKFVPQNRIIIGTTEDNGAVVSPGVIRYGGNRKVNIGLVTEEMDSRILEIRKCFDDSGFICNIYENIQQLRWNKLFVNASLSVVTAILQVPIGYIYKNRHAWNLVCQLVHEAVEVAHSYNLAAEEKSILDEIKNVSLNSPEGITSICADIQNGRKTEVDFISGAIVKAAAVKGIPVPSHNLMSEAIHALEGKGKPPLTC